MVLSVITIPEDPSPELLLWSLSRQDYTRIRNRILGQPDDGDESAPSWKQFAERLNTTGVPPLNGETEWTAKNLLCIKSAIDRHAKRSRTRALLAEAAADACAKLSNDEHPLHSITTADDASAVVGEAEKWDEEAVAAKVVAELYNGTPSRRDTHDGPDSSGVHDYDIELSDVRTSDVPPIALEITQEADSQSRQQANYLDKHKLRSSCLQHDWTVELRHTADVRPVKHDLPPMLARLEERKITSLSVSSSSHKAPFMQKLRQLGIRSIRVDREPGGPGEIRIHRHLGSGTPWHPDALTDVADRALQRKAEKLRRTCADERHLWIWIDFSLGPPRIPDPLGRLPSTLPAMATGTIGEGIDIVWIAIAKSPNPAILKCGGHAWEVVGLPESARQIITDAIERSRSMGSSTGTLSRHG